MPATPPAPQPVSLTAHQATRVLETAFDEGAGFRIPFERMRVCSFSAVLRGHGPGIGYQSVDETEKARHVRGVLRQPGLALRRHEQRARRSTATARAHNLIVGNSLVQLRQGLRGTPCGA